MLSSKVPRKNLLGKLASAASKVPGAEHLEKLKKLD